VAGEPRVGEALKEALKQGQVHSAHELGALLRQDVKRTISEHNIIPSMRV
jgi:hypothetical protein